MCRFGASVTFGFIVFLLSGCGVGSEEEGVQKGDSTAIAANVEEGPLAWNHPEACIECHKGSHDSWKGSHHANANRRISVDQDTIPFASGPEGGDFEFVSDGGEFRVRDHSIKDEEIAEWAATAIDSVIGYEPIWQYLVPHPGGRWQTHAMTWDVTEKEWFNVFGDEERDPGDWGHWTQQGMNWNSNCAFCHMTDFKKNFDFRSNSYSSSWVIEGVSCIQCHSGMEEHVASARKGDYEAQPEPDLNRAMENCASCHARREELTLNGFKSGEAFHNHFRLTLPNEPGVYFENGLANQEDYVYASFVLSKMGEKGVTCFDCHDPHTAKTKLPQRDNGLCMQCHSTGLKGASLIDEASHTHHSSGTMGASCVDCHMPERTYMGRDPRRDHGFTIPDPLSTIDRGEPNACTQCHAEKSPEWALENVKEWYGDSERSQFQQKRAHALHDAHIFEPGAWNELIALYDNATNEYWKATYLRMLVDYSHEADVWDRALTAKDSSSPIVRDAAIRILGRRQEGGPSIYTALNDSSRMVRLQAADILSSQFDGTKMAFQEWQRYVEMNSDRPAGALKRAELALLEREFDLAKQLVRQVIAMNKNNAALYYDAAILVSRTGDLDEALRVLTEGSKIVPQLPALPYAQGLLFGEKREFAASVDAFARAVALDPTQARWWYNLSIAYTKIGDLEKSSSALEKALELSPTEPAFLEWRQGLNRMLNSKN